MKIYKVVMWKDWKKYKEFYYPGTYSSYEEAKKHVKWQMEKDYKDLVEEKKPYLYEFGVYSDEEVRAMFKEEENGYTFSESKKSMQKFGCYIEEVEIKDHFEETREEP